MAKRTRIRAWDFVWNDTQNIHRVSSQMPLSEDRQRLAELLGDLYRQSLPIETIYKIGEILRVSYRIGQEDK